MRKILNILIFFYLSNSFAQISDLKIVEEYKKIDNFKVMKIDSVILKRGIDFNQGNSVDEKKYTIFRKRNKVFKLTYEETNEGYRKWRNKTIIYFKKNVPFFITENHIGTITKYTSQGENSVPYNNTEEIYINDWKSDKFKKYNNGYLQKPDLKICKICYVELIENIKSKFTPKL